MSAIKVAIREHLLSKSAITDIVGSTGVFPVGESTRSKAARITYQKISNLHVDHQGGGSGLTTARFQFNCWSPNSALQADTLGEAVREALNHFTGDMGTTAPVNVRLAVLDNDDDDFQAASDGSDVPDYVSTFDFIITHEESQTPVISS